MAAKIAIVYIITGCAWIFFSDKALGVFFHSEQLSTQGLIYYSTLKGVGYVLLTGLGLYLYSRRSYRQVGSLEKQYRALFEENPNPMWVFDSNTLRFLAVNNAAINTYGFSKEEFLSLSIKDIRPAADIPILEQRLKTVGTEHSDSGIFRHRKKNGVEFFVNIFSNSTVFENRKARMVLSIDVNERILTERRNLVLTEELKEFKDKLNLILSNVNDVIWACTADDFRVTYISNACKAMYGYEATEFYTDKGLWYKIMDSDDRENFSKVMEKLVKDGTYVWEYTVTTKDGTRKIIYDKAVLVRNDDGSPREIQGVATDITELRQSQVQAVETKNNLYALINNTSDLIWSVDRNFRFIYTNDAFKDVIATMTGKRWSDEQKDVTAYFGVEEVMRWYDNYERAFCGETFSVEDTYMVNKNRIYTETHFNPIIYKDGTITGVGCFSKDITQRKRNELNIAEQNRRLMEIARIQSHEVRGPLSTIMGLNNLFNREDPTDPDNIAILDMMQKATINLDAIIDKVVRKSYEAKIFETENRSEDLKNQPKSAGQLIQ